MKIAEKLKSKKDMYGSKSVTIAFLGDSVTQGCFECFINEKGDIDTVFDYKNAYSTRMKEILNILYPQVQINIINSGISGANSGSGLSRIDRDILAFSPDLVVVSFGLNDSISGLNNIDKYKENIRNIVARLKDANAEVIFLTQNYMNTKVSCHLKDEKLQNCANRMMKIQVDGTLGEFQHVGALAAKAAGAVVCDLYPVWEKLSQYGVDTTELLANKINHPIREWHYYIAIKLIEKIFEIGEDTL